MPKLKALRRAQITSFIEDTPSARYKVLSSFIDVSNIQKSEAELKKLITSLDREYGQNRKSLSDAKHTLTDIWNKEGKASILAREQIVLPLLTIQQFALKRIQEMGSENSKQRQVYEQLVTRSLYGNINASRNYA